MLGIENLHAYYGMSHILQGVSLHIGEGEAVSLLGRNGAGKTTVLLALMGYLKPRPGKIEFRGKDISGLPPYRVSRLSVQENLTVAARGGLKSPWGLKDVYALFPRLDERRGNRGNQLSGGEQQMLAIGRALLLNPSLLVLDEPSEGLAPMIVEGIVKTLRSVRDNGLSILIVEQNINVALDVADRHYILGKGAVCYEGTSAEIKSDDAILTRHLGV
jgi:branched-chain amino acid transport system ATP-binding protein